MNGFKIGIFLVLFLAVFLRFYNYNNRWGLATDQAHDALVARYALSSRQIPLLGPFSSAGPFQTGGEWYLFIMIGTLINPFTVISPWIFITFLYVLFVFLMIKFGEQLIDRKFGLVLGLLSAVSTAQITQSTNLTNQSPIALFSLLSIWASFKFARNKKPLYLFLMGFCISFAASIHLQGAILFVLVPVTLFFTRYLKLKGLAILLIGLILPLLPILASDLQHNFFNFQNMLHYYLYDQYKISLDVLGRRWLTFLLDFIPSSWGFTIGGDKITGLLIILGLVIVSAKKILKNKMSVEFKILLASFLLIIFVLRYTRTPLFQSYLVFLHPFILILSSFLIYTLYKYKKYLGLLFLFLVLIFSLQRDFKEINYSSENSTAVRSEKLKNVLIKEVPNRKFAVFDYKRLYPGISFPLSLFLDVNQRIDDNGFRVGVASSGANLKYQKLYEGENIVLFDLNSKSKEDLGRQNWSFVNPSAIYKETEEWNK